MADVKMPELLPCPFCGSEAHLFVSEGIKVLCSKCGASTRILVDGVSARGVYGNATKTVIEAWNRRVDDAYIHEKKV